MSERNGGHAFPIMWGNMEGGLSAEPGMTLRDYFAALVMSSGRDPDLSVIREHGRNPSSPYNEEASESNWRKMRAITAYLDADAMLAAREEKP